MPFDPYEICPVTFPNDALNTILIASGDKDDEQWAINLSDPTYQLSIDGTLRIDSSASRSQVIEIVRTWIIEACRSHNLTLVYFEDHGSMYEDPRPGEDSVMVHFQVQPA